MDDSGPGFPADFDPIMQANIGLELVHNVARWDLQADVRFENQPQGGGRVSLSIPLAGSGGEPHREEPA